MKQLNIKTAKLIWGVVIFCLATIVLIWSSYFHQKNSDKEDTIVAAIQRNSNLAVALEQYAIRTIHNADALLQLVKMEYDSKGDDLDIDKLIYSSSVNKDIFRGVGIIDERGKLVKSNIRFDIDSSLHFLDRDYFIEHSKNNSDKPIISKPVLSKTVGVPVIVISRRLNKRDGSFNGVVTVQIEPQTFTSFYAQANLRQNDIISFIAPDGTTYARRTGAVESSGEDISRSPLFVHVAKNPDSFYLARDAIRSIPTYFSYRKFKEYPIIATVGTSQADVLEGYYKRARRDLISAIIITTLIVLFSFTVCLVLHNRRQMTQRLMEEEERYQRQITEQVIAAQEREREEIGHELHDNVNQVLTSVKLYLEMALHNPELREDLIARSMKLVMKSIGEIRNLSHELSAPTLGTRSLIDSITVLIETVSSSTGLEISFDHTSCYTSLSMNQKLTIYRIIQEQLNNVVKHANATDVSITLSQKNDNTTLAIKDNGKGFNTFEKRNGIGLNNIISRAKVFNGTVEIESAPGRGCVLIITLPIEAEENVVIAV
jgi:signal transduction histidine kinase